MSRYHDKRLPAIENDEASGKLSQTISKWLFEITCFPELSTFRETLRLPRKVKTFFQKAVESYDKYLLHKVNQLKKTGRGPTCHPGCSYCCYLMPCEISTLEVIFLYETMLEQGILSRMFRRFLERQEMLSKVCEPRVNSENQGVPKNGSVTEDQLLRYRHLDVPCPLLGEDKYCILYPQRPFVCREHLSLSPSPWCDPNHIHFPKALKIALPLPEESQVLLSKLDRKLGINLPETMCGALLAFTVNVARFGPIHWI